MPPPLFSTPSRPSSRCTFPTPRTAARCKDIRESPRRQVSQRVCAQPHAVAPRAHERIPRGRRGKQRVSQPRASSCRRERGGVGQLRPQPLEGSLDGRVVLRARARHELRNGPEDRCRREGRRGRRGHYWLVVVTEGIGRDRERGVAVPFPVQWSIHMSLFTRDADEDREGLVRLDTASLPA